MRKIQIVSLKLVYEKEVEYGGTPLTSPKAVYELMKDYLIGKDKENFMVIALNAALFPTTISTISIGATEFCNISIKEIFKTAILSNASSIIVCHNHPSGMCTPSTDDIETTKKIRKAGKIMDISLLDHVIIGGNGGYYSIMDNEIIY